MTEQLNVVDHKSNYLKPLFQLRVLGKGTRTKIELNVREWQCLYCNAFHDRDLNAATNLINHRDAGGQSESQARPAHGEETSPSFLAQNGRGANVSLPEVAICCEASTKFPRQLTLF